MWSLQLVELKTKVDLMWEILVEESLRRLMDSDDVTSQSDYKMSRALRSTFESKSDPEVLSKLKQWGSELGELPDDAELGEKILELLSLATVREQSKLLDVSLGEYIAFGIVYVHHTRSESRGTEATV